MSRKYKKSQYKKAVGSKISLLIALSFLLSASVLANNYIAVRFPKSGSFVTSINKNNSISEQKGPIKISPDLMRSGSALQNPTRITIPSSKIDVSVTESDIVDGYWETSDTTASHGMGSANPGQAGNSVIFAHAREGLFYNLKDVSIGDIVYVFTTKKWYPYKVEKIDSVYPDQVEVILPTKDERLTLYTCTGYADEKRLIVVAKPIKI